MTMVTTFSLLFCSFGLNGFTELILQRENLTHSLTSNLFWINLAAGILLTVMFAALGPVIAAFYHDPVVKNAVEGISLTIIASSLSVIHVALRSRDAVHGGFDEQHSQPLRLRGGLNYPGLQGRELLGAGRRLRCTTD